MAEKPESRDPETLSVQLNEAFERLENSKSAQATDEISVEDEQTRSGSGPLPVVSMLLALIAIGIASYAAFSVMTSSVMTRPAQLSPDTASATGTDARVADLEVQLQQALAQVASVRGRLDEVTGQLASAPGTSAGTMADFEARVDAALSGLRAEIGTSSQDWLMAEVEYLIRLGNQRVTMERDAAGALALFRAADDIVRSAEGVAAFELRQALANDVAALDAVGSIDVDGIFVRLVALAGQVDNLRQVEPSFKAGEAGEAREAGVTADEASTPVGPDTWSRISAWFGRIGARLASLVDYRSAGERIRPILPPKEEYYLRQNLVLKLQMAQLGLLREDQAVYDSSLGEAASWVALHFDPDHPATKSMLGSLGELAQVNVERVMPDVSDSLREVRRLLGRFHQEAARNE